MAWTIANVERVNTDPGRDTTEAALVHLERGGRHVEDHRRAVRDGSSDGPNA
jgi:hypothetical protein